MTEITVLPVPPFGENTVVIRPWLAEALRPPARMADLAQREDDVVGQLRERQDVGHAPLERGLEEARAVARGDEDHGRLRVLADRRVLVRGEHRPAGRMHDDVEVAAGQSARGVAHLGTLSDELEPCVPPQGGNELSVAVAGPGRVEAESVAHGVLLAAAVSVVTSAAPIPVFRTLTASARLLGLSESSRPGRSWSVQSSFV